MDEGHEAQCRPPLRRLVPLVERLEQMTHVRSDRALGMTGPRLTPGQPREQLRIARDTPFELVLGDEAGQEPGDRPRLGDLGGQDWGATRTGEGHALLEPVENPLAGRITCQYDAVLVAASDREHVRAILLDSRPVVD